MLFDAASIRSVVRVLKLHYEGRDMPPLVCDPVCVSTSGHTLLASDAVEVMVSELFPLTYLVTPNKAEAELILSTRGHPAQINNIDDMLKAADNLLKLGPKAVLLKGGHLTIRLADVERISEDYPSVRVVRDILFEENMEILQVAERDPASSEIVVDVLHSAASTTLFMRPRIDSRSTHGTGCTLSAAVVCGLSRGLSGAHLSLTSPIPETNLISGTTSRGSNTGCHHVHPLWHRECVPHRRGIRPVEPHACAHCTKHTEVSSCLRIESSGTNETTSARPTTSNPHPFTRLLIQGTRGIWKEYVEHEFVKKLALGTLPRESFIHFIKSVSLGTVHLAVN